MNEKNDPVSTLPTRPVQPGDLDDLIFREEGWNASDR